MEYRGGAIGVFDSGVGGLTVFQQIAERLPGESLIYLGDTARVPYGTKSADTVIKYAVNCSSRLMREGVKLIVVACNTASAYALTELQDQLSVPVLGVIEPGARRAAEATRNNAVGVIGTAGTIASGAYQQVLRELAPELQVWTKACPLFVPLAEEGWTEGDVPQRVAREYLDELLRHDIDTLVLGCTHYPLLKKTLGAVAGDRVRLVDSAQSTAEVVAEIVEAMGLAGDEDEPPFYRYLVTDDPASFRTTGTRFLERDIHEIEWVDIR